MTSIFIADYICGHIHILSTREIVSLGRFFLVSTFRRVLHVVCFLLGNYPASEFYMPTFRNTLFHLHRRVGKWVLISPWPDQEGNKLQRQKVLSFIYPIYNHNWRNISTIYIYRGADKSLARPGRKKLQQ